MSAPRKYIRRSRQQWSELIELQPGSGLSVPKFCEQAGVSYQSFKEIINNLMAFLKINRLHHAPLWSLDGKITC